MSGEKHANRKPPHQHDLRNSEDRAALKRAGDEFLNSHPKERQESQESRNNQESRNSKDGAPEFSPQHFVDPDEAQMSSAPDSIDHAAENVELKEQLLRLVADMENLRRRTARDVEDARKYAVSNFARDLLAVLDNLARALAAVPTEAYHQDQTLKALIEGVEMTERLFMTTLERYGVQKIVAQGKKFDPHFHQAMFEVTDLSVPDNSVKEVVQEGYRIGDRVLRPAMVGVAKGGNKGTASSTEEEIA